MGARTIERIFHSACLRKANLSEEAANQIVDKVALTERKLLYFYKCPFCSSYHLTSKADKVKQKIKVE